MPIFTKIIPVEAELLNVDRQT